MEKRHINRKRHLAAAVAAMAIAGLTYQANAAFTEGLTLELTVDGTGAPGGAAGSASKTITNATVGTPITLDVWATVIGTDSTLTNDGLQSADLAFTASGAGSPILGTVGSTGPQSPWTANGSHNGGSFTVGGETDLGSTDTSNAANWWIARSGNVTPATTASSSFLLGKITFNPSNLGAGTTTNLQVNVRNVTDGALWFEDGTTSIGTGTNPPIVWTNDKNPTTGAVMYGAPIVLTGVAGPTAATWTHDSNSPVGNWSDGTNWSGGTAPNAASASATFSASGDSSGVRSVNLDANQTVGALTFSPTVSGGGYLISGAHTLTMNTTSGSATITNSSGNNTISSAVSLGVDTSITASGGTLTFSGGITGAHNLTKSGTGAVLTAPLNIKALTVGSGSVRLSGTAPSTITTLTATSGVLDIDKAKLVVDYTVSGVSPAASIRTAIIAGFDSGDWLGTAGITSNAASVDPNGRTAVGYVDNADFGYTNWPDAGGQAVPASSVLVKYTYYGDSDLNGRTDLDDLSQWGFGYHNGGGGGGSGAPQIWENGDFDYSGFVDLDDLSLWGDVYNNVTLHGGTQLGEPVNLDGVSAVPEPASLSLIALGAVGIVGRRRRSR